MDEEKSASVSLHFFPTDLSPKARNWWQFGNFSWPIGWKAEMHEAWKCRLNSFPFSIIRLLEMLKCLTFCLIQFCCLLATAGWCTSLNKMHHDLSEGKVLSLHKSSFSFLFLRQHEAMAAASGATVVVGRGKDQTTNLWPKSRLLG